MFLIPYRDENPARTFPIFTLALIVANCYLFYQNWRPTEIMAVADNYGYTIDGMLARPYVLVSSIFLHGSILHLLSNMWFLWLFGDNVEDRHGRFPYIGLFILSGIVGNLTHAMFSMGSPEVPVIGASGAVAGIMGSYLVAYPGARLRCFFLLIFYPIFLRIQAFWFIGIWMIGEFFAAYLAANDFVAHWAHVGGFAFGMIWSIGRGSRKFYARGYWW